MLFYKLSDSSLKPKIDYLSKKYNLELIPAPLEQNPLEFNQPLLRVTKKQLIIEHQTGNLFFHPSMALLRMINLNRGIQDRFLEATNLRPGDIFLDGTLGLASDSLIAAWAVGKTGQVIALEGSKLIHFLVSEGLNELASLKIAPVKNKEKKNAWKNLALASRRIQTVYTDHLAYLKNLPSSSVDIVYFDPMFRHSLNDSASIKPLKNLSLPEPLKLESINQACRVARKRVVLKERSNSPEFERLGFKIFEGGKYSKISFGIIEI